MKSMIYLSAIVFALAGVLYTASVLGIAQAVLFFFATIILIGGLTGRLAASFELLQRVNWRRFALHGRIRVRHDMNS